MRAFEMAGAAARNGHDECPLLGTRRTCRLFTFGEAADLLVSLDRELPQQIVELEGSRRLPTFENGFDDSGDAKFAYRQTQHACWLIGRAGWQY
jgi:hypothetical protein